MKLGVYTRYSELGASSRLRCFRWEKYWRQYGIEAVFHPFFDDAYLRRLYSGGGRDPLAWLKSLAARMTTALPDDEEVLYIEYELLPAIPAALELIKLRGRKFILGFDDRVELKYAGKPFLADKYAGLLTRAAGVVCANRFLCDWAGRYNANIIEIPTVIDPGNYPAFTTPKAQELTVVWIGNPATIHYLQAAAPALQKMAQSVNFELLAIGADAPQIPGVKCRSGIWSEETEGAMLSAAHIGIMPLPPDDPFAAGKSAYKLIQYMAAGIPAVASPVGENRRVIKEGVTGFFAASPGEWQDAVSRLANDEALRRQLGENARRCAETDYSYAAFAGKFAGFLKNCCEQ